MILGVAFASVLKSVPVYDYNLSKVITKLMPIQNNKIEDTRKIRCFVECG